MYDSVTWQAIPADAEIVAGYVNGLYRWPAEAWARFPNAIKLRIDVNTRMPIGSDVLDVEEGDARPEDVLDWIGTREANGIHKHVIYCNTSTIPAVRAACQGIAFDWWAAHYTGVPHLEPTSVATQWSDPPGSGGNYDISLCAAGWPS